MYWYQIVMSFIAPSFLLYQFHPRASRLQSIYFGLVICLTLTAFLGVRW